MEVLISVGEPGTDGDLASLRAWLDSPGRRVPWELPPPLPSEGTLGFGLDEILALVAAAEGLPALIDSIRGWTKNRQEAPPINVTIIILPRDEGPGDGGDGEPKA